MFIEGALGITNQAGKASTATTKNVPFHPKTIPRVGTAKPARAVANGTADCFAAIAIPCLSKITDEDIKALVAGWIMPSATRFNPMKTISRKNELPRKPMRNVAIKAIATPDRKTRFGPDRSAAPPDTDIMMLETKYPKVRIAPSSVSPNERSSFISGANAPSRKPGSATRAIA